MIRCRANKNFDVDLKKSKNQDFALFTLWTVSHGADLCRTEKQVCANDDDDDDGCLRNSFVTWIPAAGAREEIH